MCSGFQMSSFFCLRLIHRIGNLDVASIRVIVEDKRPEKAKFLFWFPAVVVFWKLQTLNTMVATA